jgi:hypothetical protein
MGLKVCHFMVFGVLGEVLRFSEMGVFYAENPTQTGIVILFLF